jgi:hypothetical protein
MSERFDGWSAGTGTIRRPAAVVVVVVGADDRDAANGTDTSVGLRLGLEIGLEVVL